MLPVAHGCARAKAGGAGYWLQRLRHVECSDPFPRPRPQPAPVPGYRLALIWNPDNRDQINPFSPIRTAAYVMSG